MTRRQQKSNVPAKLDSRITVITDKADPVSPDTLISNVRPPEDEFESFYVSTTTGGSAKGGILRPPYHPAVLEVLAQENNTLGPCVDAMETNIDGTGYTFSHVDEDEEVEAKSDEFKRLKAFFDEPWPGVSFTTIRRRLRRDQEINGNAYLEVLRNLEGEIVFLRHVQAKAMRFVRLDDPVEVPIILNRGGTDFKVNVMMRERRFAQIVRSKPMFFKEFGVTRDLNKLTGTWEGVGLDGQDPTSVPPELRATEIIHFGVTPDARTPYHVPRWIVETPSVVGSRKAEEHNVAFFDRGGVPPFLVIVQGGQMANKSAQALKEMFRGKSSEKLQAAVLEVFATGTQIDANSKVTVTVERFGSERTQDGMFQQYDKRCESHVRKSFRLPPIFLGLAEDFNFATAYASITVAEAQVFKPERDEFDERMNNTIMKALDAKELKYKSLPLAVKDITQQLAGVEMVKDDLPLEERVRAVGEIVDLELTPKDQDEQDADAAAIAAEAEAAAAEAEAAAAGQQDEQQGEQQPDADGNVTPIKPQSQPVPLPTAKAESLDALAAFADTIVELIRTKDGARSAEFAGLAERLKAMTQDDADTIRTMIAVRSFAYANLDIEGLAELSGCAITQMSM